MTRALRCPSQQTLQVSRRGEGVQRGGMQEGLALGREGEVMQERHRQNKPSWLRATQPQKTKEAYMRQPHPVPIPTLISPPHPSTSSSQAPLALTETTPIWTFLCSCLLSLHLICAQGGYTLCACATAGMFLGASLLGLHMSMTHAITVSMVARCAKKEADK